MRHRARFEYRQATRATLLQKFVVKPALDGTHLGHDPDPLAVAGRGLRECILQGAKIRGAPDEARQTTGARDVQVRA